MPIGNFNKAAFFHPSIENSPRSRNIFGFVLKENLRFAICCPLGIETRRFLAFFVTSSRQFENSAARLEWNLTQRSLAQPVFVQLVPQSPNADVEHLRRPRAVSAVLLE